MSRISFRENGEEHNFWQNYTDLMSGFLIIFIITSLIAYGGYKVYVELTQKGLAKEDVEEIVKNAELYKKIRDKGLTPNDIDNILVNAQIYNEIRKDSITADEIKDFVVNMDLYRKILDFQAAQDSIKRKYFKYNRQYQRFECAVNVEFDYNKSTIPPQYEQQLRAAGKEIGDIINIFSDSKNVSFKIVIEGRAAKEKHKKQDENEKKRLAVLSYNRARELKLFWKREGLLNGIEQKNGEVFICGSGLEGKGRYSNEEKNKTFIIQIIPYITN